MYSTEAEGRFSRCITEVSIMCFLLFGSNSDEKIREREKKWREEELEEEYDELDGIEDADY